MEALNAEEARNCGSRRRRGLGEATGSRACRQGRQGRYLRSSGRARRNRGRGNRRRLVQGRCDERRKRRCRFREGARRSRARTCPGLLRWHRQCDQDRQPLQGRRIDQALPDRRFFADKVPPNALPSAKYWVSERAQSIVDRTLQLFGGYGYMNEYPIAQLYKDVRIKRIYGGTGDHEAADRPHAGSLTWAG